MRGLNFAYGTSEIIPGGVQHQLNNTQNPENPHVPPMVLIPVCELWYSESVVPMVLVPHLIDPDQNKTPSPTPKLE